MTRVIPASVTADELSTTKPMERAAPEPEDVDTTDTAVRDVLMSIRYVSDPDRFLATLDADAAI